MKHRKFAFAASAMVAFVALFMSMALVNKDYDLSGRGIPLVVSGPEGAVVDKGSVSGDIDGVNYISASIKKGYFLLDVTMADAEPEESLSDAVESMRASIEEDETFKAFTLTEEHGYIAKLDDEGEVSYDFGYIVEKDDRHIIFSQSITLHAFTEAEIKAMYAAAASAH